MKKRTLPALVRRILSHLATAQAQETDLWLCDDLRVARMTVAYAARGDAVCCSPHVLASYAIFGLHPERVWPAILARRQALCGPLFEEVRDAPPKKPAQSVQLWSENTKGARAVNSRAVDEMVLRGPRLLPMATASIAALYPNSDAPSSAKKRPYSLKELETIVAHSGAPPTIVAVTLAALSARGAWPNEDGPATTILCVSLLGIMYDSTPSCCRRTAQRRIKRALKDNYWRSVRGAHSWIDCPKCGKQRDTGKCDCGYQGRSKDAKGNWTGEFMRVPTYEFDIDKFRHAPRCREIRHFDARTYAEYKEAAKRGEHPNVTPIRQPAKPAEPPRDPAPAAPLPAREQPAATDKPEHRSVGRSLTPRQRKELARRIDLYEKGCTVVREGNGYIRTLRPGDRGYVKPMERSAAVLAACRSMCMGDVAGGLEGQGCAWERAKEAAEEMGALPTGGNHGPSPPREMGEGP